MGLGFWLGLGLGLGLELGLGIRSGLGRVGWIRRRAKPSFSFQDDPQFETQKAEQIYFPFLGLGLELGWVRVQGVQGLRFKV